MRVCAPNGDAQPIRPPDARDLFEGAPVVVAHTAMTARRLGCMRRRAARWFDVLELFAFVRPARFAAPSAVGLAQALGLPIPRAPAEQAASLHKAARALLTELGAAPTPSREEAIAQAETLARAGWPWGVAVLAALRSAPAGNMFRGSGLDVWTRLAEWEAEAPPGEPGSNPVQPDAARGRLAGLLAQAGLSEPRPAQADYAAETAHVFQPREREGEPNMMLAEAGTGVGKTLGYLAPLRCGPRRTARPSGSPPTPARSSGRSSARAPPSGPTRRPARRRPSCARGARTTCAC